MEASNATVAEPLRGLWQGATAIATPARLSWAVIGFGVLLRAAQYISNPALYVDEGALVLNLINRTFAGLLEPLDSNQAAPAGFLLLEKIAVVVFGDGEHALRLFPFLFSIAALVLFYAVARRVLMAWAVPVALLFFAVSGHVVYYAAQVKQYSGDIALTLLVVLVGLHIQSKDLTARRANKMYSFALLASIGAAVVWFSHPSVFALAGAGTTLALIALKRKEWSRLWKLAVCYALWVSSFAAFYLVSLSTLSANQTLEMSWLRKGTFMPLPPASLSDLEWFPTAFFRMFSNPVGSPFPIVAGIIFIAGCVALLKKNKAHLLMLISPILFTLVASGLHKYPFGRRLLLFAIPLILMVIVAGIEFIVERSLTYSTLAGFLILELMLFQFVSGGAAFPSPKRLSLFIAASGFMILAGIALYLMGRHKLYAAGLGSAILLFLLFQPVGGATNNMLRPRSRQDIRPIMNYVKEHRQPGDITYSYHHQRESFEYYAPKCGFTPGDYILGIDAREHWKRGENEVFLKDLDQLRGKGRVWVLFSHVRRAKGRTGQTEEDYFVEHLDRIGRRLDRVKRAGAAVYLYDMSEQASPPAPSSF